MQKIILYFIVLGFLLATNSCKESEIKNSETPETKVSEKIIIPQKESQTEASKEKEKEPSVYFTQDYGC